MAGRARLTAPRETQPDWPWHTVRSAAVQASLFFTGHRRMEAAHFLTSGFATRLAIESRTQGWTRLQQVARTWQPSRLKGIQVRPEFGTPFLAATQVYDLRPIPRKWLALHRTSDYANRFVSQGTILLTCSGSVGRATLASAAIDGVLISHDLLRIEAREPAWWGWLYAYLRAPTVRAMMKTAQYGHIIKHLETPHLDALPIVLPTDGTAFSRCNTAAQRIVACRNAACQKINAAEAVFAAQFPPLALAESDASHFVKRASTSLFGGRRRFDAGSYHPQKTAIERRLRQGGTAWTTLQHVGCDIWLPNRFKRVAAEEGVALLSSSHIFEINPDSAQRIAASGIADKHKGFVCPGWLMMARSGQVYGLLGSVALATAQHREKLISDDVIRIKAGPAIAPGYLYVALSHPTLGRPRAKALAYGSSVPHIAVDDLKALAIPRLHRTVEQRIAALVEDGVALWAEADARERRLAAFAEEMLQAFLTRSSGGGSGPRTAGAGRMEKTPHRQTKRVAG